jgi:hypothetical protein
MCCRDYKPRTPSQGTRKPTWDYHAHTVEMGRTRHFDPSHRAITPWWSARTKLSGVVGHISTDSRLLFTYPPEDAHWVARWVGRPGRETEASHAHEAVTVLTHDAFRSGFVAGS